MSLWKNALEKEISLRDPVFAPRQEINRKSTIPANIGKCRETGRIDAFRLNWKPGMPNMPHVFWDSDFAKVLEGMAEDLMLHPDPEREKELNDFVDLVISAQQPDGYLNTHFTVVEPEKRWTDLASQHELYCAGHLMEAAVAHFRATGKRNFLEAMCRYADCIGRMFGPGKDQKHGYPGHEEIELALCKLADASGKKEYLRLSEYFLKERGKNNGEYYIEEARARGEEKKSSDFRHHQAEKPLKEMPEVSGHAVRMMYLCCGLADAADRLNDPELMALAEKFWESTIRRNMYVTGGVGSTWFGEAFTRNYHLPNATAYTESCAAIGLALFAERMLNITQDPVCADVLEKVLYNGALSGLGLDGITYFYQNPLEIEKETSALPWGMDPEHGYRRQAWFSCSCCPTNYCRFLPQIGTFAFSRTPDGAVIHIPCAAEGHFETLSFTVGGSYPWDGAIPVRILQAEKGSVLRIRIPGWCGKWSLTGNGQTLAVQAEKGYLKLEHLSAGDEFLLKLEMPVRVLRADPRVSEDAGKIVLVRGPVVYALESVDNPYPLSRILIPAEQTFRVSPAKGLPAGTVAVSGECEVETLSGSGELYGERQVSREKAPFTAIPSALWQNRGDSSMRIWIRSC